MVFGAKQGAGFGITGLPNADPSFCGLLGKAESSDTAALVRTASARRAFTTYREVD